MHSRNALGQGGRIVPNAKPDHLQSVALGRLQNIMTTTAAFLAGTIR